MPKAWTTHTRHPDWRWQLRHAVTTADDLARGFALTSEEVQGIGRASQQGLSLLVTPYYAGLADPTDPGCPIRRQFVPSAAEATEVQGDLADPLGEQAHEVAPHLIQRYPDRALLLVMKGCAVHCRFCTRSRLVKQGRGATALSQLGPALSWLRGHPEIREVILSGGDPLLLSTGRLEKLVEALRKIPHIDVIRIGTRVPCALPMRIDDELVTMLRRSQPIWFMVHFNHPKELTAEAKHALAKLADAGFPVMSQTVLLRGVNDDPLVLEALFRALVRERVRPYYLLHADVVAGTGHLRTKLDDSIRVYSALQGRLSGLALPKLVVDTPGGRGKVVVGPEVVVEREPGRTRLRTFRDELVDVFDPPDEP